MRRVIHADPGRVPVQDDQMFVSDERVLGHATPQSRFAHFRYVQHGLAVVSYPLGHANSRTHVAFGTKINVKKNNNNTSIIL